MADTKITALTALTAADPANDVIPIVDVSDTTMAASGTTKKISVNNILGASGTATLASATITGDLTVDTSTLKVDSTNDRVGIGTTTPAYKLEVVAPAGDNIVSLFRSGDATAANNAGGGFRSISSATAASRVAQVWLDADGANFSGGDYFFIQKNGNSGTVEFNQSSNAAMTFLTNATERARFNNTGAFVLAGGTTTANGIGITFPITPSASSDAKTLDDYEEGTWVPTDASGAGLTFTVSACRYTKVGRTVTIQGNISYPVTVSTANATWGGFPFNAADVFNLSIIYTDASVASLTYISSNTTNAFLLTPGVFTQNVTVSGKVIVFSGTYMI